MHKYIFVQEVLDDIQLIWTNCKTYNIEGSVSLLKFNKINQIIQIYIYIYFTQYIFTLATQMEKFSKKVIDKYYKVSSNTPTTGTGTISIIIYSLN